MGPIPENGAGHVDRPDALHSAPLRLFRYAHGYGTLGAANLQWGGSWRRIQMSRGERIVGARVRVDKSVDPANRWGGRPLAGRIEGDRPGPEEHRETLTGKREQHDVARD